MVGSTINGGRDADFRAIARTKPERERHRTRTFRGRYRRSLAETRGRNLDPGFHREQSQLLFLLLGRSRGASVGGLCVRSICACRFGGRMIVDARDWLTVAISNSATPARPGSRCCVSRAGASPASGTMSGWMKRCSSIRPTGEAGAKAAIWMRSCWPRACRTASQRPALPFRPAERPWPGRGCRDFRPRSSQPFPCRSEAGT